MAANLGLVLVAVASPFVLFIAVLAYGAWLTRGLDPVAATAALKADGEPANRVANIPDQRAAAAA